MFLSALQVLAMGGSKSKAKDVGQRTRSLDGNLGSGGGAGSHHLNSTQQSLGPNRSPTIDGGMTTNTNDAGLSLFGGVDNNTMTANRCTIAGESIDEEITGNAFTSD